MNEADLRALVREAVARHLGGRAPAPAASGHAGQSGLNAAPAIGAVPRPGIVHPSHAIYLTVVNTSDACVIEPAVPCDHCGYCKSHGH